MQVEIDKLKLEVKRQQDIAMTLANLLNEKIDECGALEKENTDLREALHSEIYS